MKNKLINSHLRKLTKSLIFLCFLLLAFVISCRKERHQANFEKKILSQNSSDFLSRINAIKIKYYDLNLNEKLNKNTSQNFKWAPNWDNPIVQTVNDTVSYVFFPMQAQKQVDGRLITAKELDSKTYLIVKNEKDYFKGIFYQPSSIGEPKTLSLFHFSGRLLLSSLATKEGFIIDYNNGEPLKTNLSNTVKLNKTSNIGGLSSTTITNCTTIEYCSYMSDGPCRDGSWYLLYRLDCNSIYNSRYSCNNWNLIDYFSETTCETIHTFEDPPMPPEEGGGSSSGDDTSPTTEQAKTPCSESIKLAQDDNFKNIFQDLKNKVKENKEYGYILTKDANGNIQPGWPINGNLNSPQISFNMPKNLKIDGFLHSHYTGLLPIFSFGDLVSFAMFYKNGNLNKPKTFCMGVVTASGTQYLIFIEDIEKFKTFADEITRPNVENDYGSILIDLLQLKPTNTVENNEISFLKFLNITNSGLTLLKGTENLNNWERMTLSNDQLLKLTPCN